MFWLLYVPKRIARHHRAIWDTDAIPKVPTHTSVNFISMVVTRAISNFSKIHTFLICRMQKWKKNGSSLDMANNLKVAFFGQILSNLVINMRDWLSLLHCQCPKQWQLPDKLLNCLNFDPQCRELKCSGNTQISKSTLKLDLLNNILHALHWYICFANHFSRLSRPF